MTRIHKGVIYSLAAVGLVYLLFLGFISFGPILGCEVTDIRKTVSPSDRHHAKLVVRECKDDTSPMLELNLSNKLRPNKFHIIVIGRATTTDADLTWLSDTALQVSHPASFRPTQRPTELDGIEIKFVIKRSHTSSDTDALSTAG